MTRALDGVDPDIIDEIHHAAGHVPGVKRVTEARARWLGHALTAEVTISVSGERSLSEATKVSEALKRELRTHIPNLSEARIAFAP